MAKEVKRKGVVCKNEHDTLLAIKVALLTQISNEAALSNQVFWIFDNLPNMHNYDFKSKKCEKCKGKDCEAFKQLRDIKKMVSDPGSVKQGIHKLTNLYQIPSPPYDL
ncbi:MAG: hypothetical protein G8237_00445 [Magnetococcales bacterium]|nr:hypothetical protein [Magnetococcales bacterium]NGZ04808.1 hypothetical protein [Magnetococcales bacterium]